MSSKIKPWDFMRFNPEVINSARPGIWAIHVFDAFMERLLIKKIPRADLPGSLSLLLGQELTPELLESRLQTQDLFDGSESLLVIQSENIPKSSENFLLEASEQINDRFVILFFAKHTPFLKKLNSLSQVHSLKMHAPDSWEDKRYLSFLADEMRVKLPADVFEYLRVSLPMASVDYVHALNTIRLHLVTQGQKVELKAVKELISASKVDNLELTRLFTKKDFSGFYRRLLELNIDDTSYVSLFSFIEGQLVKLRDTNYVSFRNRATRWDENMLVDTKLWGKDEIRRESQRVSEFLTMAKSKSDWLRPTLQKCYYESLMRN